MRTSIEENTLALDDKDCIKVLLPNGDTVEVISNGLYAKVQVYRHDDDSELLYKSITKQELDPGVIDAFRWKEYTIALENIVNPVHQTDIEITLFKNKHNNT